MRKREIYTKSLSSYARHRGVSPSAVTQAIATGRLHQTVARDKAGKPSIPDFEAADREWDANTRLKSDVAASAAVSVKAADYRARIEAIRARKMTALADLAEIKLAERSASLVPIAEVERDVPRLFKHIRERLAAVVPELATRLPQLTPAQLELIAGLVAEASEEVDEAGARELVARCRRSRRT